MYPAIGTLFALFVFVAVSYAFSPRHGPTQPATVAHIEQFLILDATRAGPRLVAVGERGRVFLSDDDGTTWREAVSPTEATLTGVLFIDARQGVAVGHDAVILRSEDGGERWQEVASAADAHTPLLAVCCQAMDEPLYALGAYGLLMRSDDAGRSWQTLPPPDGDAHLNGMARLADGRRLIVGEAGTLLRSEAAVGQEPTQWRALDTPYQGSFFGAVATGDGGVVAYGMRGRIFRSPDGGDHWVAAQRHGDRVEGETPVVDTAAAAAATEGGSASLFGGTLLDDGTVMLVGQGGEVWLSRDQGQGFRRIATHGATALAVVPTAAPGRAAVMVFGEGGPRLIALPQTAQAGQP